MHYALFSNLKLLNAGQEYTFIVLRNAVRSGSSITPKVKIISGSYEPFENPYDPNKPLYPIHEKHQTRNTLKSLRRNSPQPKKIYKMPLNYGRHFCLEPVNLRYKPTLKGDFPIQQHFKPVGQA